jgi:hypothetical protein
MLETCNDLQNCIFHSELVGCLDFVHHPVVYKKNLTISPSLSNLVLGLYMLYHNFIVHLSCCLPLIKPVLKYLWFILALCKGPTQNVSPVMRTETGPVSKTSCCLVFRIQWAESKNLVILSVICHHLNPTEYICTFHLLVVIRGGFIYYLGDCGITTFENPAVSIIIIKILFSNCYASHLPSETLKVMFSVFFCCWNNTVLWVGPSSSLLKLGSDWGCSMAASRGSAWHQVGVLSFVHLAILVTCHQMPSHSDISIPGALRVLQFQHKWNVKVEH